MPRALGIDAIRFVMAYLVVLLHSMPIQPGTEFTLISILCRAAVPFFLITSGYFISPSLKPSLSIIAGPLRKSLPVYAFWMVVYYSVAAATGISDLRFGPRDLVSGGTAFHLWYLPAAGFALVFVASGVCTIGVVATGLLSLSLALIALAFGPYHDIIGLPGQPRRGGLLLAPSYVFLGYWIARARVDFSVRTAIVVVTTGVSAIVLEEVLISCLSGASLSSHDFIASTFIFGLGAFLLAKSLPISPCVQTLSKMGELALGIYVSQLMFLWAFRAIIPLTSAAEVFALSAAAFAASAALTALMRNIPVLKRVVG